MSKPQLLRFRRTDDAESSFVLINVESAGTALLDLRLTGTDGSSPFVGHLKQSNVAKLRNKGSDSSIENWTAVLSTVFVRQQGLLDHDQARALETVANVDNRTLHLVIRKNIGGITRRLGAISLEQDDEVEIALFDWSGQAAISSAGLRAELAELHSLLEGQKQAVKKLNAQLDELTKAKDEHEDQLIRKFAELLNSKKLKIRNQQRLLATAKLDPRTVSRVGSVRDDATERRAAHSSRAGKRKAVVQEDDSEDGFEARANNDDDEEEEEEEEEEMRDELQEAGTPEASDDGDETEGSDNEGIAAENSQRAQITTAKKAQLEEPPPKRELPFNSKPTIVPTSYTKDGAVSKNVGGATLAADQDDDETDDEL